MKTAHQLFTLIDLLLIENGYNDLMSGCLGVMILGGDRLEGNPI